MTSEVHHLVTFISVIWKFDALKKLKKLRLPLQQLNGLIARTAKDPSKENTEALEAAIEAVHSILDEMVDDQNQRKTDRPNPTPDRVEGE